MQQGTIDETHFNEDVLDQPVDDSGFAGGLTFSISGETLAYLVLIMLSVLMRVADLDTVAITQLESHNALAAYQTSYPIESLVEAGIDAPVSDSPVQFWLQRIALLVFDSDEVSVRLFTALAGALLGFIPFLFREFIGRSRAFLFAVLLTFSPMIFISSRFGSDAIWAINFALLGLWAFWHYWRDDRNSYAVVAIVFFTAMILLSGPSGPMLALILLFATTLALTFTSVDPTANNDSTPDEVVSSVRARLAHIPWGNAFIASTLTVFIVATGFMFYPSGLSMVGAVVEGFLSNFTQRIDGAPSFFPLIASLFYEPWAWILAGVTLVLLMRRNTLDFVTRFLVFWVIGGIFAMIFSSGAGADYALWVVVPLLGLVTYAFEEALIYDNGSTLWLDDLMDGDSAESSSRWGRWALGIIGMSLLFMFFLHLQIIARGLLNVPEGSFVTLFSRLGENLSPFALVANSLIWLLITLMFMLVGFFLAASIWGNRPTLRGGLLSIFLFMLVSNISIGWNTAVTFADSPVEPWHIEATTADAQMLRTTLIELDMREAQATRSLPIHVQAERDGVAAWLLRDFQNITFISDAGSGFQQQVVLLQGQADDVTLGGSYVGQPISLTRVWSADQVLKGFDFLPWLLSRDVRADPASSTLMTLWVRQDVYDSAPVQPQSGNGVG